MREKPEPMPERPFDDGIIQHPEPDPFAQSTPTRLNKDGKRGCIGSLIVMFAPYSIYMLANTLAGGFTPNFGIGLLMAATLVFGAISGILFVTLDRYKEKQF